MSVETALHAMYAADAALVALLPATKFSTGRTPDETTTLPYANLSRESNPPDFRTNCGRGDRGTWRIKLWHDNHASGQAISEAMITAFDDKDYTGNGVELFSVRKSNDFHFQEDDGVWQFVIDLEIRHRSTA